LVSWSNILLIFTILTTLSTTAYLALFIVLLISLKDFFLKRPVASLALAGAAIFTFYILYTRLDFLNKKIDKEIAYSNKGVPGESRFNSFLADMRILGEHPFVGTGRNIEMKFGKNFYNLNARQVHRNNGVGVLLATYGVFFFILFFFLMWVTFCRIMPGRGFALLGIFVVLLIGFSEDYFFKVYFISLALFSGISFVSAGMYRDNGHKKLQLGGRVITGEI
jgi:hypothetical protein